MSEGVIFSARICPVGLICFCVPVPASSHSGNSNTYIELFEYENQTRLKKLFATVED